MIQPAKCPGVFGSVPAAMVRRLAKCVRSGATLPPAGVPRIVWQRTQDEDKKTVCPFSCTASAGRRCRATLFIEPCSELIGRLCHNQKGHVGVLIAAKLGALPAKHARLVGLK